MVTSHDEHFWNVLENHDEEIISIFKDADALFDRAKRVAGALECGVYDRQRLGREYLLEKGFDRALEEAGDARVAAVEYLFPDSLRARLPPSGFDSR